MILYRIAAEKYADDLSGEGARIYGGRWNRPGSRMFYTSEHESLAILEVLAHSPIYALPGNLMLCLFEVPDRVDYEQIDANNLSPNWRDYPAPSALQEIGEQWLAKREQLILKVPSVLSSTENNWLINPRHSDFEKVNLKEKRPFSFDERLQSR